MKGFYVSLIVRQLWFGEILTEIKTTQLIGGEL
jgi:hypothetical protein